MNASGIIRAMSLIVECQEENRQSVWQAPTQTRLPRRLHWLLLVVKGVLVVVTGVEKGSSCLKASRLAHIE